MLSLRLRWCCDVSVVLLSVIGCLLATGAFCCDKRSPPWSCTVQKRLPYSSLPSYSSSIVTQPSLSRHTSLQPGANQGFAWSQQPREDSHQHLKCLLTPYARSCRPSTTRIADLPTTSRRLSQSDDAMNGSSKVAKSVKLPWNYAQHQQPLRTPLPVQN